MTYRKKLIEVAIPLDAINKESADEKYSPKGHPGTLHLWWARRPLASCRAVLFTSFVDDPGEEGVPQQLLDLIDKLPAPDPQPPDWAKLHLVDQRRQKLFAFIERLVKWESTTDDHLMRQARDLIYASTGGNPPPVLDPFCGGGSIPLEAQRLGLQVYASDLNPVAVLITKALVEIPPKFAGRPPVNPADRKKLGAGVHWKGAAGLAADVRYYGAWMRDQALKRIGHLYPKGPNGETVIAWLWARTVKCPNPACGGQMPLLRSFALSTKPGRAAWVEPVVDRATKTVSFKIRAGTAVPGGGTKERATIRCVICDASVSEKQLREQASKDGFGQLPTAVVVEGHGRRDYLEASAVPAPTVAVPETRGLDASLPDNPRWFSPPAYGLTTYADLFTPRQLVALTTFSDLVAEARTQAAADAAAAGLPDGPGLADGGDGAQAYADAVATYLGLTVDRVAATGNSLVRWNPVGAKAQHAFGRQALPMIWDFAEPNPFANTTGGLDPAIELSADSLGRVPASASAVVSQLDAVQATATLEPSAIATDPPYYDNIGYADLSDFFYVWLRRSLSTTFPALFSTLLTPKLQELIAAPYRLGGDRAAAERHFEQGMTSAFARLHSIAASTVPLTLYYAFKQAEAKESARQARGIASTGWEKMLGALIAQGLQLTATWPMRTESASRQISMGTNALASSVVIACRPRPNDAPLGILREFTSALARELPAALRHMTGGHIAPVDLRQAAIGPGMAVFSRYSRVLEPDGSPMTVRRALEIINDGVDHYLSEMAGSLDRDTQFCVAWFEEFRFGEGRFGRAEDLAHAINVGVDSLARAGLLTAERGRVQLARPEEYAERALAYDPAVDPRPSAWKACHYLIAALATGEDPAGRLLRRLGGLGENARELAYHLYAICERKGWSSEGRPYNLLADSWPAIRDAAARAAQEGQAGLL